MVTSTRWWTSAVLPPNFSNGLFVWESQSLQKEAKFLFLLAWCKNIGTGDCFETASFSWLMLLVLILCTCQILKRLISVTGPKPEEEVLREEPVGCCSWWWLGEIWCGIMNAFAWMNKVCFMKGLKVISAGKSILLTARRRLEILW